jgi:hypothetical protein
MQKVAIAGALLLSLLISLVIVLIAKPFGTTDEPVTKKASDEQTTSSVLEGGFLMK